MKSTARAATASHVEDRRRFFSEAFHSFNQPLTSLHCGLELILIKPRSEEEYRARTQDALLHAGAILELNTAVRALAESIDPGEKFGRMEMEPFVRQLASDLTVVGETAMVSVKFECNENLSVEADPLKLARNIGNLGSQLIHSAAPGASLALVVRHKNGMAEIAVILEGNRREIEEDGLLQSRLDQIRRDTACSYTWTLGGEFCQTKKGFVISLPALCRG